MYADSFRIYLEQQAVAYFFTLKGLKARAIHTELESAYDPKAPALPTVKKWRKRSHQGRTDLIDDPRPGRPLMKELAGVNGFIFEERPFSWCKVFCRCFRIGEAIWLRILHDKLGLKKFRLPRVLHALSMNQKSEQVFHSNLILTALMEQKPGDFQQIPIRDAP